jgi:hypothetical protein
VVTVLRHDAVTRDLSQHHADGEDIGRLVEATGELFGCKVVAVTFTINTCGSWPLARQAEVRNLEPTLKVDEDVGRLEVEVNVTGIVDELDTL